MPKFIFFSLCLFLSINSFAQNTSDNILGQWTNEDHTRVLEFVKKGAYYEAIILKAEPSSLIGKNQITSLKYDKGNAYKGGTLHVFQKEKTAKCSAKLLSDDKLELKASNGLASKTSTWTRVNKKNTGK